MAFLEARDQSALAACNIQLRRLINEQRGSSRARKVRMGRRREWLAWCVYLANVWLIGPVAMALVLLVCTLAVLRLDGVLPAAAQGLEVVLFLVVFWVLLPGLSIALYAGLKELQLEQAAPQQLREQSVWTGQWRRLKAVTSGASTTLLLLAMLICLFALWLTRADRPAAFMNGYWIVMNILQPILAFAWLPGVCCQSDDAHTLATDPFNAWALEQSGFAFLSTRLLMDIAIVIQVPLALALVDGPVDYDVLKSVRSQFDSPIAVCMVFAINGLAVCTLLWPWRLPPWTHRALLARACKMAYLLVLTAVVAVTWVGVQRLFPVVSDLPWLATVESSRGSTMTRFPIPMAVRRSELGARIDALNRGGPVDLHDYWSALPGNQSQTRDILFYGDAVTCYDQCCPQYRAQDLGARAVLFGVHDAIRTDDLFGDARGRYNWDLCADRCQAEHRTCYFTDRFPLPHILVLVTETSYYDRLRRLAADRFNLTMHTFMRRDQLPLPVFPPWAFTKLCLPALAFMALALLALTLVTLQQDRPVWLCRCRCEHHSLLHGSAAAPCRRLDSLLVDDMEAQRRPLLSSSSLNVNA